MVEWKKLGEVCDFQNGFAFKSGLFKPEGIPVIRITNISSNNIDMKDCKFFAYDDYKMINLNPFVVEYGDILLAMSGATTGKIGVYKGYEKAYLNQRVGKFVPHETQLNKRYLYHFLSGKTSKLNIMAGGGAQPNLSSIKLMEELILPVPSIPQQAKISCFLDTFTSSIENLKEQIALRRKQYEYYRDLLLDLEGKEGVEMKTLGEVCLKTHNIKWKSEQVDTYYDYIDLSSVIIDLNRITETTKINKENAPSRAQQIVKTGDVLLGTTRPTLKRICQVSVQYNNQICSTGYCIFRAKTEIVLNRWIFHNIGNRKFWDYCEVHQQGAGYPCLSNTDAFAYRIPVPSLSDQQRIVSILDTFEASIQNLEAQLAEREKQYEYYRNKLLTFE